MSYLLKGGIIATFTAGADKPQCCKSDILVEDSTITQIAENINAGPGVEVIDCEGKWISPGMIDTHRHIQSALTADEVHIGQLAGCLDALHSGVTTLLDHFHAATTPEHANKCLEATIKSGARVIWCPARQSGPTQVFPTLEWANDGEAAKWQMEMLRELGTKDGGKLTADGRVTLGLAYDLVGMGPVSVHQAAIEFAREIPVALITAHVVKAPRILTFRDAGLLGPDIVFSHCNCLFERTDPDDEMWEAMKEHGCAIASTPVDELGMAHGRPVAMEAVRRGVKCGLGADCLSINGGRTHEEIDKHGLVSPRNNKHHSADAFRLATLGGAEALNMQDIIGSIEVGKKADLVVFDTDSVNLAGINDPISGITFHATNADVELVMVNGEIVKRDHKLTKVEWGPVGRELKQKAAEVRERFPPERLEALWSKWYDSNGAPVI
ncbi:predicted protein [Postia placenta Mad-698-R]|nr:predicted protein [Postia placenta Mad-698-R]